MKFVELLIVMDRLVIRAPTHTDMDDICAAMDESRIELQKWMAWASPWPDIEQRRQSIRQSIDSFYTNTRHKRFGCFARDTGRFVVSLGCTIMADNKFHVSYWARTPETGKGYTTEAVRAFVRYLFNDLRAVEINSGHEVGNMASARVLEKCGFVYQGDIENIIAPGRVRHEKIYAIKAIENGA